CSRGLWFFAVSPVCLVLFLSSLTPTAEIYSLSLHDALPICVRRGQHGEPVEGALRPHLLHDADRRVDDEDDPEQRVLERAHHEQDRKSTRLNSSHVKISYAVFCLKKKTTKKTTITNRPRLP